MNSSSIESPALPLYLCSKVGGLFFLHLIFGFDKPARSLEQYCRCHLCNTTSPKPWHCLWGTGTLLWLSIVPVPRAGLPHSVCLSLSSISRASHYGNAKNCPWQEPNPHMLRFWSSSGISGTRMPLLILEEWILLDKIIDQHGSPTLEVGLSWNSVPVFKFW